MEEGKSKFVKFVEWVKGLKDLKNKRSRLLILILCAALGIALGVGIVWWGILNCLFPDCGGDEYSRVRNSLVGVIIGLPVFVVLWVFRTMDTREQIEKTQEQINFDFFSDAKKSFLNGKSFAEKTVGFIQLAELQQQDLFVKKIKVMFERGDLNRIIKKVNRNNNEIN